MRILRTSYGKEYIVDYAWAPIDDMCLIGLHDNRRLPEIASEFDGVNSMQFIDEEAEKEYEWKDYTRLVSISTALQGITISLAKEK